MPMQPASIIISTLGAGVVAWGIGRLLARRIPPWHRRSWGVLIVLTVVVALVISNSRYYFFSREYLRLLLMFIAAGWIIGIVGYRD